MIRETGQNGSLKSGIFFFAERIRAFRKKYFRTQPVNPGAVLNPPMRRRETGKLREQGKSFASFDDKNSPL